MKHSAFIRLLLRVGFVKVGRKSNEVAIIKGEWQFTHPLVIRWPFCAPSWKTFSYLLRYGPRVYRFRNLPGVASSKPGRLLPARWGGGVLGFEFGDRG